MDAVWSNRNRSANIDTSSISRVSIEAHAGCPVPVDAFHTSRCSRRARDSPETALHVTSRGPTPNRSTSALTCRVVWTREVVHGVVNYPRIDGKDGVASSIPAGMHTAVWAGSPSSEGCQTDVWCGHRDLAVHAEDGMAARRQWSDLSPRTRRLLAITAVVEGILKLEALIDLKGRPTSQVRGPKWVWATVVTVVSSAGVVPISYFVFGRRQPRSQPD